jgi:hypothetical protein
MVICHPLVRVLLHFFIAEATWPHGHGHGPKAKQAHFWRELGHNAILLLLFRMVCVCIMGALHVHAHVPYGHFVSVQSALYTTRK